MQEEADQVTLPNGNDTVQSRLPPPEEERASPFKVSISTCFVLITIFSFLVLTTLRDTTTTGGATTGATAAAAANSRKTA